MEREELIAKLKEALETVAVWQKNYENKIIINNAITELQHDKALNFPTKRTILAVLIASALYEKSAVLAIVVGAILIGGILLWHSDNKNLIKNTIDENRNKIQQLEQRDQDFLKNEDYMAKLSIVPEEFWYYDAINYFYNAVRTGKADSLKEAMKQFELLSLSQESLRQQQAMNGLLHQQNIKLDDIASSADHAASYHY